MPAQADLYLSVDIEGDGPIPGPYSMLAAGICVAGRLSESGFERIEPERHTLYLELKPISEDWLDEALAVSSLSRERLVAEGQDPPVAMGELARWIEKTAGEDRPVICAYPAAYDWLFLYWYLERFASGLSALTFSSCLDMKTLYAVKAEVPFNRAGRDDLPEELRSQRRHTHNALDDAQEQAEIFANLMEWAPRR